MKSRKTGTRIRIITCESHPISLPSPPPPPCSIKDEQKRFLERFFIIMTSLPIWTRELVQKNKKLRKHRRTHAFSPASSPASPSPLPLSPRPSFSHGPKLFLFALIVCIVWFCLCARVSSWSRGRIECRLRWKEASDRVGGRSAEQGVVSCSCGAGFNCCGGVFLTIYT